jgi:hypothetical protein
MPSGIEYFRVESQNKALLKNAGSQKHVQEDWCMMA